MRHNAGAHSNKAINPSKAAIIISIGIVVGVIVTAMLIAIFVA